MLYVSATGATTVQNLAYAHRLGLWGGEDFPFFTRPEFTAAIEDGGVAAMEVLARDLKALGLYTARSLSYDGVEYELVEHPLHAKHPVMVLLHGGSPKGAELIAAKWADTRKIPQIAFKPDWTRHNRAAPFKRNDAMLEVMPIGIVLFPGSGVTDNLADKAKVLGIPSFDFRRGTASQEGGA